METRSQQNTTIYDVIVVGAGIMGSCTAYHLSKTKDMKLLLLEQVRPKLCRFLSVVRCLNENGCGLAKLDGVCGASNKWGI